MLYFNVIMLLTEVDFFLSSVWTTAVHSVSSILTGWRWGIRTYCTSKSLHCRLYSRLNVSRCKAFTFFFNQLWIHMFLYLRWFKLNFWESRDFRLTFLLIRGSTLKLIAVIFFVVSPSLNFSFALFLEACVGWYCFL